MPTYRIGVLPGDGIGEEIVASTVDVLSAASEALGSLTLEFLTLPMGQCAIDQSGVPLPEDTLIALSETHGFIAGPHDSQSYPRVHRYALNPSGLLRKRFELYANLRPAKNFQGVDSVAQDTDLVIVRENTEGFYPDRNMYAGGGEFMPTPDLALVTGVFTRKASERIARTAFDLAMRRRKRVCIVHKRNVIPLAYGLFIDSCMEIAKQYPEVTVETTHIDAFAARLVTRANELDVVLTTNMFGDILSDLTAALTGSLGLAPSLNIGDSIAMAQAAHGAAPDIAGAGVANPSALILSAAMLMEHLSTVCSDEALLDLSASVRWAVEQTLAGGTLTLDLGGSATTAEFTMAVISQLSV